MVDFSIIIHPVNIDLIYIFDPDARKKRISLLKKILEWTPAFYTCKIEDTKSITGKEIEGHFIMCPLLPDQILNNRPDTVLKKVIDAGRIAEALGSKILGLAAYTSLVGRKGALVAKSLKIPVTTGTCYTIAIGLEGLIKAADKIGLDLTKAQAAVIGATGAIGSISSQFLANRVSKLTLIARNKQRLNDLAYMIHKQNNSVDIRISDNINESIKYADIIFVSTSTPATLIDTKLLQPGTIICDMSQPRNVSKDDAILREDILVVDGGVVKPPGDVNFNFNFGLAPGLTFACIAETMILAFEEKYESYSIGGNVSLSKIKEISLLATKHGFRLAKLRSFDKEISEEQIWKVRDNLPKGKRTVR